MSDLAADHSQNLPVVIDSLRKSWVILYRTTAVACPIFTILVAQLLILVKNHENADSINPAFQKPLLVFSYGALIFNLSTTISSFILIGVLGQLTFRASHDPELATPTKSPASSTYLLKRYGAGTIWVWMTCHWMVCFFMGIGCMLCQIVLYIWLHESLAVKITISCVAAIALSPLIPVVVLSYFQEYPSSIMGYQES